MFERSGLLVGRLISLLLEQMYILTGYDKDIGAVLLRDSIVGITEG